MKWIQYCTVIFTSPSLLIFQVNFVKLQLTTTNRGQTLKRQLYTRAGCCLPSQTESYLLLPEGTDFHTSTSLLLERGCPLEYQHQRHIGRGWTCPWSDPSLWELVHHREKNQGVQGETQQKAQQKFGRWTKLKTLVGCHSHWQHPTGKQSKRSGFDQENTGRSGSCRGTNTVVSLSGVTSGTDKEKSKKEYRCWASGRASLHFHSSKNLSIHGTARKKQIRKSCVFQEWITDRKEVREFKSKWIECFCFSHKTHSKACIHFQLLHLHTFHRNFRGHGRRLGSCVQGGFWLSRQTWRLLTPLWKVSHSSKYFKWNSFRHKWAHYFSALSHSFISQIQRLPSPSPPSPAVEKSPCFECDIMRCCHKF